MNLSSNAPMPSSLGHRAPVTEAPIDDGADRSALLDGAYDEYCRHIDQGETIDPDAFCDRFPQFQSSLHRLLEAHRFIYENPLLLGNLEPIAWPEAGQTYLGFRLVRELGRGAFARVFLARQIDMGDRFVVVKIARHGDLEAATLGRLNHPNVVDVYSRHADATTGMTVICMPYQGSATLCDVIDRIAANGFDENSGAAFSEAIAARTIPEAAAADGPRLPPLGNHVYEVRRIALALAEALDFVHAKGILHRDLKPSNVLMSAGGQPLLLDFNLSTDNQEASNRIGGTLPYMSPEQLREVSSRHRVAGNDLDARSDLYSLGVILYELLTAKHPFGPIPLKLETGKLRDLLLERQQKGPPPIRTINPRVDAGLARLVEGCLAFNREERPKSAADVVRAVRKTMALPQRAKRWVANLSSAARAAIFIVIASATVALVAFSMREPYSVRQWQLGQEHYRQGRYAEAVEDYNRALEADPNLTAALFDRGRAQIRRGEFTLAIADFQKANERAKSGRALACIGYCFSSLKQHGDAVVYYQRAIDASYAPAEIYNDLGYSCYHLGKYADAHNAFSESLALDASQRAAYYNRAMVYLAWANTGGTGDAELGIVDMEKALAKGPHTAELLRDAACLYAIAGKPDAALRCLEQAVDKGFDPRRFANDNSFNSLKPNPAFVELVRRPAPAGGPTKATRLVDPIDELPAK